MKNLFALPKRTVFDRVIPKNAFVKYTNTRQKKLFTQNIERIRWTHKLAENTINLKGSDVQEIQVFEIELRKRENHEKLVSIIDKSIPYPIIFLLLDSIEVKVMVSKKHPHPQYPDNAVIDWTFQSDWLSQEDFPLQLSLKESLDHIITDLSNHISHSENKVQDISDLVDIEQKKAYLQKEMTKLEKAIKRETQFNRKVEMNLALEKFKQSLKKLL